MTTCSENLEGIEEVLLAAGALSITCLDAHDSAILEPAPGETPLWPELIVSALFDSSIAEDSLIAVLSIESALPEFQCETLPEQDWSRVWMDEFKPMRFGSRVWVCPSWCAPPDPHAVNLLLDPGLAFGTGTHPTTALCLQWLDAHAVDGQHIVDYGCGSGILSLAALKLGALHVTAVDIDPQALIATRNNFDANGISSDRYTITAPATLAVKKCDIVLANILSSILIQLSDSLTELLNDAGNIVMSGILAEQVEQVIACYEPRYSLKAPILHDGWALLEGRRLTCNCHHAASCHHDR